MDTLEIPVSSDMSVMLQHLEILFDQQPIGRIEIAWRNADGKGFGGKTFDVGDLDEAAKWAAFVNQTPGQNVYVGASLRKLSVAEIGRCSDEDFLAAVAVYVDCDEPGVYDAAYAKVAELCLTPPLIVITGAHPHTRAQMWWPLETKCENPEGYRNALKIIATELGGDTSVHNPSRIMRIGGSIAWPIKDGRVQEQTALFYDAQHNRGFHLSEFRDKFQSSLEEVMSFPGEASALANFPLSLPASSGGTSPGPLNLYNYDGVSVIDAVQQITTGQNWHNNMIQLVAHWIGRGWSDYEIQIATQFFTLPGYDHNATAREVKAAIDGARKKWLVPNPLHDLEQTPLSIMSDNEPFPVSALDGRPLPVRQWLVFEWIKEHAVNALYGAGGVGKTLLAQQLGTCIATGHNWLGMPVKKMPVLAVLCEDDEDELHIRQEAINKSLGLTYSDVSDLHLWNRVGYDNLLVTFGADGHPQLTDFHRRVISKAEEIGAGFIIMDTVADLFGGNEIIRSEVNFFIKACMGQIVLATGGTVLQLAHPSVAGLSSGTGTSGSTAWENAVRSRLYLERPKEGLPEERIISRKKSNYAASGDDTEIPLFYKDGVLGSGALLQSDAEKAALVQAKVEIMRCIDEAWEARTPYKAKRTMSNSIEKGLLPILSQRLNISMEVLALAFMELRDGGDITTQNRKHNVRGWSLAYREQ